MDAGSWPLVILAHYDGNDEFPYGMAVYTEGDIDLKEFKSREERNRATDEWAVWWWTFNETEGAPTELSDNRLGPYRATARQESLRVAIARDLLFVSRHGSKHR